MFNKHVNFALYLATELAIIMTDLAEVIGCAIALNLLFGLPLIWGVLITAADVMLVLNFWGNQYKRFYEVGIVALVLTVSICFVV